MATEKEEVKSAEAQSREKAEQVPLDQLQFRTAWFNDDSDMTVRVPAGKCPPSGTMGFLKEGSKRNRKPPFHRNEPGGECRRGESTSPGGNSPLRSPRSPFAETNRREGNFLPRQHSPSQRSERDGRQDFPKNRSVRFNKSSDRRPWIPAPPPEMDCSISFYATDECFKPIAERIQKTGKTYATFPIAKSFLDSPEKFVFVLRKNSDASAKFYYSPLDGIPFSSVENAVDHLIRNHRESIFTADICEGTPPHGNFSTVVLCPFLKKPIAAQNHHSYRKLLYEHFLQHVYGLPFESFCDRLETSSAQEDVQSWLDSMKQTLTYRIKRQEGPSEGPDVQRTAENPTPSTDGSETKISNGETDPSEEMTFSSLADARRYLIENPSDHVHTSECVRVPGTSLAKIYDRDMRRFVEFHWQQQKRFPLETANALRSKLKQNNLYCYKRGKKGISYVCAAQRKFRGEEARLADAREMILDAICASPLIRAEDVAAKLANSMADTDVANHLTWLIHEGHVTEFEDGTLLVYQKLAPERADLKTQASKVSSEQSDTAEEIESHGTAVFGASSEEIANTVEEIVENVLDDAIAEAAKDMLECATDNDACTSNDGNAVTHPPHIVNGVSRTDTHSES
ncbi:MAG: hypothetical protein LBI69_04130 [Puniceicoccales bacterium]|jgi:hypothetical protein|nr:hypothetical protein [Puniceicoccales bacterium]